MTHPLYYASARLWGRGHPAPLILPLFLHQIRAQPFNRLHQQFKIPAATAVVCNCNAERKVSFERGAGRHGDAGLLNACQKFLVERVQLFVRHVRYAIPKTNDIQGMRCGEFKVRRAFDESREVLRLGDVLFEQTRGLFRPKVLNAIQIFNARKPRDSCTP